MLSRRVSSQRRAFTLTEMMVATALTLFIMAIIASAYRAGLDTFSKLNTANQLQQKLTNASKIIQRDLGADHFQGPFRAGFSGPKLSDQRLDRIGWQPPTSGYFWMQQGSDSIYEAYSNGSALTDGEGLGSSRNASSRMSFTIRNPSSEYLDQFAGRLSPAGYSPQYPFVFNETCHSSWAQVHYFLTPTAETTEPVNGVELPIYTLRRQLWVLAPDDAAAQVDIPIANTATNPFRGVRVKASPNPAPMGATYYNVRLVSPSEAQKAHFALPAAPATAASLPVQDDDGNDIIAVNVLSFEVKAWYDGLPLPPSYPKRPTSYVNYNDNFRDPNHVWPGPGAPPALPQAMPWLNSTDNSAGSDWPFNDLPHDTPVTTYPSRVFDTWYRTPGTEPDWDAAPLNPDPGGLNTLQPPLRIRIKALQIKIRIWDPKTKQARQLTFVQEV